MEFGHGRDRLYIDEHEDVWNLHVSSALSAPSSSSSAAAAAAPFRWNNGGGGFDLVEKEHMFDKVVTPSDVGKLNRLVIPKQHAEKYFPLDGEANAGGKGLLLSFEDRTGKSWRFRYSYWNSSQSYVMTKGWSRFVKDKRLDAGDTVSFGRGVGEGARDRLFIDWKRRRLPQIGPAHHLRLDPAARMALFPQPPFPHPGVYSFERPGPATAPWGGHQYHHHHLPGPNYQRHPREGYGYNAASTSAQQQLVFFRSPAADAHPQQPTDEQHGGGRGDGIWPAAPDSGVAAVPKSLRLFGVNLLCPAKEGDAGRCGAGGTTLATFPPSSRETCALPLHLQHCSSAESSLASSSSTSKEQQQQQQQHSSLDLDL